MFSWFDFPSSSFTYLFLHALPSSLDATTVNPTIFPLLLSGQIACSHYHTEVTHPLSFNGKSHLLASLH
jgi:hypothetical protein